jgi:hypothetical protein
MVTEDERNELARLIANVGYDDWYARSPRSPVKYYALKDADRLFAAGYRKEFDDEPTGNPQSHTQGRTDL